MAFVKTSNRQIVNADRILSVEIARQTTTTVDLRMQLDGGGVSRRDRRGKMLRNLTDVQANIVLAMVGHQVSRDGSNVASMAALP